MAGGVKRIWRTADTSDEAGASAAVAEAERVRKEPDRHAPRDGLWPLRILE